MTHEPETPQEGKTLSFLSQTTSEGIAASPTMPTAAARGVQQSSCVCSNPASRTRLQKQYPDAMALHQQPSLDCVGAPAARAGTRSGTSNSHGNKAASPRRCSRMGASPSRALQTMLVTCTVHESIFCELSAGSPNGCVVDLTVGHVHTYHMFRSSCLPSPASDRSCPFAWLAVRQCSTQATWNCQCGSRWGVLRMSSLRCLCRRLALAVGADTLPTCACMAPPRAATFTSAPKP